VDLGRRVGEILAYCSQTRRELLFGAVPNENRATCFALLPIAVLFVTAFLPAQKVKKGELEEARAILRQVQDIIEKRYYDPTFRGVDLRARFASADKQIGDQPSFLAGLAVVAWAVEGLNDSHTTFVPPLRNVIIDKGWQMVMVGEKCLISAVQPGSDAEKRGLRPGDEILKLENYQPNRSTFAKIDYRVNVIAPLAEYHFVVASPGPTARQLVVKGHEEVFPADIRGFNGGDTLHQIQRLVKGYRILGKSRFVEMGDRLMIWKLPEFNLQAADINRYMGAAKKHETLILDLRDNRGGDEETLRWLVGNFFDQDITVGDKIGRTGKEPLRVPARNKNAFTGKLIVLVNSQSASSAEIFARVVQLEKRGTVMGDQTSGEVGRAEIIPLQQGAGTIIQYAVEVTISRLLMPDGQDLEGSGVVPDTKLLPTQEDMAAGRDPVLSAAAQSVGVTISPEEAGKLFPVIWLTH
jgi:C-terminal processing protease CtpA/Prc